MNKRRTIAKSLLALGCLIVLLGSILHLSIAYPRVSSALAMSNLDKGLTNALRAVFFMIGLNWIAIAVLTLMSTFAEARASRPFVLFCGFALLLQVPIWVSMMGWFVGNEMFALGAGLIVCGGLLFPIRHV